MPYNDHSADYSNELQLVMRYIESMLDRYPGHSPIILDDFKFKCQTSHKGFNVFSSLSTELQLVACDDLDINNVGYSYIHESLNQRSLIDHVLCRVI